MKNRNYFLLLFTLLLLRLEYSYGQMYSCSSKAMFPNRLTLKKTLKAKRPEEVKYIYCVEYTDSVFPNNDLLKFTNVEHITVMGRARLRKRKNDSLLSPTKIRIDTSRLCQLPNLKYLQFTYIVFNKFPTGVCFIPQLKGLTLSVCCIDSIPKEISNLRYLESLECRLNNISFLPKEINNLDNLLYLDLTNNNFDKLPNEILELKKLKKLNLSNAEYPVDTSNADYSWPYPIHTNKIDYISQDKVFNNILEMPHLQKMCISVDGKDKKDRIKNNVRDIELLKKICW